MAWHRLGSKLLPESMVIQFKHENVIPWKRFPHYWPLLQEWHIPIIRSFDFLVVSLNQLFKTVSCDIMCHCTHVTSLWWVETWFRFIQCFPKCSIYNKSSLFYVTFGWNEFLTFNHQFGICTYVWNPREPRQAVLLGPVAQIPASESGNDVKQIAGVTWSCGCRLTHKDRQ